MKDPLQIVETPHELLKLEPGADRKAIDKAWMAAQQRKAASPAALKLARDTLLDPVARLEHELLQYRHDVFQHLAPSPLADPSVLDPAERPATLSSWQRHLKKDCSDIWVAHSLAVCWYWWTLHEEETFLRRMGVHGGSPSVNGQAGGTLHTADVDLTELESLRQKWRSLIGYWSMVATTPSFWSGLKDVTESQSAALRDKFTARLHDRLRELGQGSGRSPNETGNGSAVSLAEHYRSLEHDLATELATAREFGEAGILKIGGQVCYAGPLLLREMSILDKVRALVAEKRKHHPKNRKLKVLEEGLGPIPPIKTFLDENKPEAALEVIRRLPDVERQTSGIARLRSRAHHMLGRQKADLGKVEEALSHWREARRYEHKKEEDAQIVEDVVSTCLAESNRLEGKQIEKAIGILEQGLKVAKDDERLQAALANLLTRRGVKTINDLEADSNAASEERERAVRQGTADLERAAKLGNRNAGQLAEQARDLAVSSEASTCFSRGVQTINAAVERTMTQRNDTMASMMAAVVAGYRDIQRAADMGLERAETQIGENKKLFAAARGWEIIYGTTCPSPSEFCDEVVKKAGKRFPSQTNTVKYAIRAIRSSRRRMIGLNPISWVRERYFTQYLGKTINGWMNELVTVTKQLHQYRNLLALIESSEEAQRNGTNQRAGLIRFLALRQLGSELPNLSDEAMSRLGSLGNEVRSLLIEQLAALDEVLESAMCLHPVACGAIANYTGSRRKETSLAAVEILRRMSKRRSSTASQKGNGQATVFIFDCKCGVAVMLQEPAPKRPTACPECRKSWPPETLRHYDEWAAERGTD